MNPAEILAAALADIEAGRKTAAQCAAEHPEVPELADWLAAARLAEAWPAPELSAGAQRRILADMRAALPRPVSRWPAWRWQPRLATLTIVTVCLALTVGIAQAAGRSLPGQPLYTIKRATEALQVALTAPDERASVYAELGQRRLVELQALADGGALTPERLAALAHDLQTLTEAALHSAEAAPAAAPAWEAVRDLTHAQHTVLSQFSAVTAGPDQPALQAALSAAQAGAAAAERRLTAEQPAADPPASTPGPTSSAPTALRATSAPVASTATLPANPTTVPTQPATSAPPATDLPPGLAKKTEPAPAAQATLPAASTASQGQPAHPTARPAPAVTGPATTAPAPATAEPTSRPHGPPATPPGLENKPTDPAPAPTNAPPGLDHKPTDPAPSEAAPTACPTNPAGQPKCKP